jgi:hypothetical protein
MESVLLHREPTFDNLGTLSVLPLDVLHAILTRDDVYRANLLRQLAHLDIPGVEELETIQLEYLVDGTHHDEPDIQPVYFDYTDL